MRKINEIIVHCSATRPEWFAGKTLAAKVKEIKRWHVEDNGWNDIGYHFIVDQYGNIAKGRDVSIAGAHVPQRNANSIGICLIGGHGSSPTDKFDKNFTPEQDAALRELIDDLQSLHDGIEKVSGHNDYANRACPGFKVGEWLTGKEKSTVKSTTLQASTVQMVAGTGAGVSAISALDGTAQLVVVGFVCVMMLAALWIMRERLKKWANGDR
jgi:N-acetylmuramoyl-L-alanine amidase